MSRRFVLFIWYLFPLLSAFKLCGQQNTYIRFTQANGLPSNNVYYTLQDSKGYLWIGTDKGVSRYDGYSFKNFTISDGLSDSDIFQIYEDSQNRIWFVTYNGKLSYYKNGEFHSSETDSVLSRIKTRGLGLKITEDKNGNLWYITNHNLIKIKPNGKHEDLTKEKSNGINSGNFAMEYANDKIFLVTSHGVRVISDSHEEFIALKEGQHKQSVCKSFVRNDTLFFCTLESIYMFNIKAKSYIPPVHIPVPLNVIADKKDNQIFLGTNEGLRLYDFNKKNSVSFLSAPDKVSHIGKDKDQGIWVSTLNNGLVYIPNSGSIKFNLGAANEYTSIYSIKKLATGDICFGSDNLKSWILRNGKLYFFSFPHVNGKGIVKTFSTDEAGQIYATTNSRLIHYRDDLNSAEEVNLSAKGIRFFRGQAYCLTFSSLVSSPASPNILLHKLSPKEISKSNEAHIKPAITAKGMSAGTDSITYIYGPSILMRYNFITRAETHLNSERFKKMHPVNTITITENGTVLMGTQNGLWVIHQKDTLLFNEKNGLTSTFINAIFHDEKTQTTWLATESGIAKIKDSDLFSGSGKIQEERYNVYEGLADHQANDLLIHDDTLWVASASGVTKIAIKELGRKNAHSFFNIEKVEIDTLTLQKEFSKVMEFNYGQNIRVEYTAISLRNNPSISYRYKLEGANENWNDTRGRELEFPKLPPGDYTLKIYALNQGAKASDEKVLRFKVLPLFYQTLWFRLLIFALICLIILMITVGIVRKQKKRLLTEQRLLELENEKLEAEKKQALHEKELLLLEQKALRLHINPHFIFNSISAISGFYISGDYEKGKEYTAKFSKLLRLILTATSNPTISLASEMQILENYFELMLLRFENKFTYSIRVDTEIEAQSTHIPCMLFQPLAENALLHGIAPLSRKGKIIIAVKVQGNFLICSIEDNGVGRKKAKENSAGKIGTSTGMMVTQQRIELHNKLVEGLKITDKINADGESEGTLIEFRILIQNKTKPV